MPVHVFWDNSNIWLSAKNHCDEIGEAPRDALRIHFLNLHNLATKGRMTETKVISGSIPPDSNSLWNNAKELGYDTHLLKRVKDERTLKKVEQAVDESLHLAMANVVLDFPAPQTMILLSGDGKVSGQNTSFPNQVERALKFGWNVEVYTWNNSYNRRAYQKLIDLYGSNIRIIILDEFYINLTYIKGKPNYDCEWRGASYLPTEHFQP